MNLHIVLPILATTFFAITALAEGISVNPGKWAMTTTMEMTMMPQPQTRHFTECIEDTDLGPDDFNMDKDSPCDFSNVVMDGNSVSWSISCPSPNGTMEGEWKFTSERDSIAGSGSMSTNIAGQSLAFKMNWEGRRIGDCE